MLTDTKFDFAKIVNPIDLDTFFQEYWESKPLHLSMSYPEIRVVVNQQELLPAKYTKADRLNLNQLYKAYHEDHTIVINRLNKFWHPLAVFCSDLQNFLHHTAVANMYLSPPNSKGLHPITTLTMYLFCKSKVPKTGKYMLRLKQLLFLIVFNQLSPNNS